MMIEVLNPKIDLIRYDRTRGASELALLALGMLAEHAITAIVPTAGDLLVESKYLATALAGARISMAPVAVCVQRYLQQIGALDIQSLDVEQMREQLDSIALQCINDLKMNRKRSIEQAAALIQNGQCIACCSYSSTVIEALVVASASGKKIRVIWPESRFDGHSYGTHSQSSLDEYSIPCQMVEDHDIDKAIQTADMVLLGADTVLPTGDVINGYPSLLVVKATRRSRGALPVYCLADSSKILWSLAPNQFESGLDKIPHEWLEGIITENGILHPRQLSSLREKNR